MRAGGPYAKEARLHERQRKQEVDGMKRSPGTQVPHFLEDSRAELTVGAVGDCRSESASGLPAAQRTPCFSTM